LINYSEEGNNWIPLPYAAKESALGMGGGEIAPEIPSGENKVTINVNLIYQIK